MLERVAAFVEPTLDHDAARSAASRRRAGCWQLLGSGPRLRAVWAPGRRRRSRCSPGPRGRSSTAGSSRSSSRPRWPPTPSSGPWRARPCRAPATCSSTTSWARPTAGAACGATCAAAWAGLTQALARAAREPRRGDPLRGAEVARILVRDGRVTGVVLESGDEYRRPDRGQQRRRPRDLPAAARPGGAARRSSRRGGAHQLRERLAQDQRGPRRAAELPRVSRHRARPPAPGHHPHLPRSRLHRARLRRRQVRPALGAAGARVHDPLGGGSHGGAARPAPHVDLRAVRALRAARRRAGTGSARPSPTGASTLLDEYAPNFRRSVLARQVLTPLDLERTFRLTGGNIFQGAMTPGQLFSFRPVPGYAGYRTPVAGLYLCGAAAHPGGGVMGAPGWNAAREILRARRRRFAHHLKTESRLWKSSVQVPTRGSGVQGRRRPARIRRQIAEGLRRAGRAGPSVERARRPGVAGVVVLEQPSAEPAVLGQVGHHRLEVAGSGWRCAGRGCRAAPASRGTGAGPPG